MEMKMILDPRSKIDLLKVLKFLISGELSIQSFYRIIKKSCEEKDASKRWEIFDSRS